MSSVSQIDSNCWNIHSSTLRLCISRWFTAWRNVDFVTYISVKYCYVNTVYEPVCPFLLLKLTLLVSARSLSVIDIFFYFNNLCKQTLRSLARAIHWPNVSRNHSLISLFRTSNSTKDCFGLYNRVVLRAHYTVKKFFGIFFSFS
jgi:hypothetical protein